MKASSYLLIRRGRVLTPWSRTRYRWLRLRGGHALFQQGAGLSELDPVVWTLGSLVRVATLPLFALVDVLWWPVARLTIARAGWTVVRVDFHDADAEFVRVGEAASAEAAKRLRHDIATMMSGES